MKDFIKDHVCNIDPMPADLLRSVEWSMKDDTVQTSMGDGGCFEPKGMKKTWDTSEESKNIRTRTFVINGVEESASEDAVKPFLENIADVKLVTFEGSTHCPHLEEKEKHMEVVGEFLSQE